ncbi:hypothetical protein [Halorubrum distributum]|uniref:hypothetical protein n=1 Tax=Halorubrum distributum TaxID=29283 RepID=UPI000B13CBEA|nr:hypothetical protein [Halorubrum litoreum]
MLEDLWENLVLARDLDGELDREEAIERVGRTKVEGARAEGRRGRRRLVLNA